MRLCRRKQKRGDVMSIPSWQRLRRCAVVTMKHCSCISMDDGMFSRRQQMTNVKQNAEALLTLNGVSRASAYQKVVFALCWLGGAFAGMSANLFSVVLPQALGELTGLSDRAVISHTGS